MPTITSFYPFTEPLSTATMAEGSDQQIESFVCVDETYTVVRSASPSPSTSSSLHSSKPIGCWSRWTSTLRRLLAFIGPGYLIAVGYVDPGNWVTDIQAGSKYEYKLLFIILFSNLMAMILQHLAIRLGVVTGLDLAQACREYCNRKLNWLLYVLCEIAIVACDLSEIIGTAYAFKILFGLPFIYGVLITVFDVLILLSGLDKKNFKFLEALVIILVAIIGICFIVEVILAKPNWANVGLGFLPIFNLFAEKDALLLALGIIGATVMPHNLYLHSSIVKNRADLETTKNNLKFATIDSSIALVLAMFVNAAIMIVAGALRSGSEAIEDIISASKLLENILGKAASIIFGLALFAAGQSSTMTGTIAGQIVFEGFLELKMKPWIRRLVTRAVAIIPAILVVAIVGDSYMSELLVYTQVILSFQLPFAIIPLLVFTSRKSIMGEHVNPRWLTFVGTVISLIIISFNITLIVEAFGDM